MVTLQDIREAQARLLGVTVRTELIQASLVRWCRDQPREALP